MDNSKLLKSRLPVLAAGKSSAFETNTMQFSVQNSASSRLNTGPHGQKARGSYVPGSVSSISSIVKKSGVSRGLFSTTPQKRLSTHQNRFSTVGSQSARRSSVIGERRHGKDTRPLQERTFHQECIAHIIKFLIANGYPHPMTKTFLQAPTSTETSHVFQFLFNCVDAKINIKPMDTQIPSLMQLFGYPYQINKSCLVSASSNTARGQLLGMMSWLVDAVSYHLAFDPVKFAFESNIANEGNVRRQLLKMVMVSDTSEEKSKDYIRQLCEQKYCSQDDVDKKFEQKEALFNDVEQLKEEIEQLSIMPSTLKDIEQEIISHEKYNKEMEGHIDTCLKEINEMQAENEKQIIEIKALESKRDELIHTVESQQYNLDDIQMLNEREKITNEAINDDKQRVQLIRKEINQMNLERLKQERILASMLADIKVQLKSISDEILSSSSSATLAPISQELNDEVQTWFEYIERLNIENLNSVDELREEMEKKLDRASIIMFERRSKLEVEGLKYEQESHETEMAVHSLKSKFDELNLIIKKANDEIEEMRKEQLNEMQDFDENIKSLQAELIEAESRSKRSKEEVAEKVRKAREEFDRKIKMIKETQGKEMKEITERKNLYEEMSAECPKVKDHLEIVKKNSEVFINKKKKQIRSYDLLIAAARKKLDERRQARSKHAGGDVNSNENAENEI